MTIAINLHGLHACLDIGYIAIDIIRIRVQPWTVLYRANKLQIV